MVNPSTNLIKGAIFEDLFARVRLQRLLSIRWNFVLGKRTTFNDFSGNPYSYSIHSYSD